MHPESYLIAKRNRDEIERLKQEAEEVPKMYEVGDDKDYFTKTIDVIAEAKEIDNPYKY